MQKLFLKISLGLGVFFVSSLSAFAASAQDGVVNVYFFGQEGCPHCAAEEEFLARFENDSAVQIHEFDVKKDPGARSLLKEVGEQMSIRTGGVPLTVIGRDHVIGFGTAETTGSEIQSLIDRYREEGDSDCVGRIQAGEDISSMHEQGEENLMPEKVNLPLLGETEVKSFSLPALTVVVGALDGFNPCAMWVLIFLIGLLLGLKDRARMWLIGLAFIAASGLVYFVFMSAWLNLFLFLNFMFWVRLALGVGAVGVGIYFIREYVKNKNGACKVTKGERRQRILERLKEITQNKNIWWALGGVIALAFAVNLIELLCSAGLPAVYTQVLALSDIPAWQYYFYILLYVIVFMLDDIVVFLIAMVSLKSVTLNTKYSRITQLVGGIVMLILGVILVFAPQLLVFG